MSKQWVLGAGSELRCEVKEKEHLVLHLLEGNAEIFGVELAIDHKYCFSGEENIAVFSWYGCKLETEGSCQTLYTAEETPMTALVNIHAQLEARRDIAFLNGTEGPRVMMVGPQESGRSTVSRILAMYAGRLDHSPILADIDVSQGMVTPVSGSLSAISVDKNCVSIEENFDAAIPLVYFFGHTKPNDNEGWYKHLVSEMASTIAKKQEVDTPEVRASGLILNTGSWSDQAGTAGTSTELLYHAIEAFDIDIVVVIGHERLYSTLSKWSKDKAAKEELPENEATNWRRQKPVNAATGVTVVKLARSGGVVSRSEADRRRVRRARVHDYFYGKPVATLPDAPEQPPRYRPHRMELSLSDCTFLRAGGVLLSDSMRPLGSDQDSTQLGTENWLQAVPPTLDLEHAVMAVLQEGQYTDKESDKKAIGDRIYSNVAGFLYVVKVEPDLNTITVLSPCPGRLPSANFLVGSIKWVE